MNVKKIVALNAISDFQTVLMLPDPFSDNELKLDLNDKSVILNLIESLDRLWLEFQDPSFQIPAGSFNYLKPRGFKLSDKQISGIEAFHHAVLSIATYYSFAMQKLFLLELIGTHKFKTSDILRSLSEQTRTNSSDTSSRFFERELPLDLFCLGFQTLEMKLSVSSKSAFFDSLWSISALFNQIISNMVNLSICSEIESIRWMCERFIRVLLCCDSEVFDKIGQETSARYTPNKLDLKLLPSIARRDKNVLSTIGEGKISKYFEQQVGLLFQTFGLFTVPAPSGKEQVDLICIAPATNQDINFLVEAKTSASFYDLPTDDSRAIEDYIQQIVEAAGKLEFVLIVGQNPGTNLEKKLRDLEGKINVKVRYCCIEVLVEIRNSWNGTLDLSSFCKTVKSAENCVLTSKFSEIVIERLREHFSARTASIKAKVKLLQEESKSW